MATVTPVDIGAVTIGGGRPLVLIGGPCVIESEAHAISLGTSIAAVASRCGVPYIFKASFDKANRTSLSSYRGPGLDEGLRILATVRAALGVPVLTDIHEPGQAERAARVVDVIQIPAFLCRQTDLRRARERPSTSRRASFYLRTTCATRSRRSPLRATARSW
jgi:2-dehydro-3-deoxyphosphooctonate aldolase (KDO 8-P synthase)